MNNLLSISNAISTLEAEMKGLYRKLNQEKDSMFSSIVEITPNFVAIVQQEKFVFVNSKGMSILNCKSLVDIEGVSIYAFIDPAIHETIREHYKNRLFNDSSNPLRIKMISTDDVKPIYLDITSTPFTYLNEPAVLLIGHDVTLELLQKEKIREAEQRCKEIFDNSHENLFLLEVHGESDFRVLEVNAQIEKGLGLPLGQLVGKKMEDLAPASIVSKVNKLFQKCIDLHTEIDEEIQLDWPTGKRYYRSRLVPIFDSSGTVYRINGICWDVTEQKRAEQLLHEEQQLFNGGPNVAFKWNAAEGWSVEHVSLNVEAQFGYTPEDFTSGKVSYPGIIHPDDYWRIVEEVTSYSEKKVHSFEQEYRIKHANGDYRWVFDFTVPVRNSNGIITHFKGYINDITERKQAEDLLSIREQEFRTLVENSPDVVVRYDTNCNRIYLNPAFLKIADFSKSEMIGKPTAQLSPLPSEVAVEYQNMLKKVIVTSQPQTMELRWSRPDGDLWLNVKAVPEFDKGGNVVSVLALSRDLTELVNAQQQLEMLGFALNNASEAVFISEEKSINFIFVNDQACLSLGYSREELLGLTVYDIYPDVTIDLLKQINAKILSGKISIVETKHKRKDGIVFPIEITNTIYQYNGKTYVMNIVKDITERKQAEENQRELDANRNLLSEAEVIATLGNFYLDLKNNKSHFSKGIYNIIGLPFQEETMEDFDIFKFVHPDDIERAKDKIKCAFETKNRFDELLRVIDNSGVEKVVQATGGFVTGSLGNELFLGNIHDISAVHALKKQVVIGEDKLRILIDNSPVGIFVSNGKTPLFINKALLELVGVTTIQELLALNPSDLVHPDDKIAFTSLIQSLFYEGNDVQPFHQLTLRGKETNNHFKTFDFRIVSRWMDGSKYIQIFAIDITDEIEKESLMAKLASDSLFISQKSQIISTVKKELDSILHNNCSKCNKEVVFHRILAFLKSHSDTGADWGLFNKQFKNLHPAFIANLKKLCPSLTQTDVKHCACIRLHVDTKETARFFNVAPASIQTSRVRLKQKLNIPKDVDLRDFIDRI